MQKFVAAIFDRCRNAERRVEPLSPERLVSI